MENMLIVNNLCPSKKRLAFDIFTKNQLQVQGERLVKYMAMIFLLELARFNFAAKVARYDE